MCKVEDGVVRERLEASLGGGCHASPGKLTTKTGIGVGKEMGGDSARVDPM